MRRGEILESAGRMDEARAAYAAALEAIQVLPASRRSSRAMQELREQALTASEELNRNAAGQRP